ncbi:MAG: response regulator [Bacteroidetes bacterium]|nr:MAG: response regulator [Bacteroidota bacterium]
MKNRDSQARVLIVDDEPHIVLALEYLMQQCGFDTENAGDGREALDKIDEFSPDVVILDVMMPHMDGFEVAHEIRKRDQHQDAHILFLTARGTDKDKREGYGSGADVYLTKPFDNRELVEKVKDLLGE